MNRLNFNQSVGFPLETDILDEMQTSWSILNALGNIAGNFTILQGCIVAGTTVSDGTVFINGEVIEFKGGQAQENVIIIEQKEALEFEDGNANDVIYKRYATFGAATTQWPWAGFTRPLETKLIAEFLADKEDKTTVDALLERVTVLENRPSNIPIGLIAIWDRPAAEIPDGWQEYVDLRGRMPLGHTPDDTEFSSLRSSGGAKNKTLSLAELPAHFFTYLKAVAGRGYRTASDDNPYGASENANTNTVGENKAFSLMNPYRIVHFIKYTG
ncbi:hypothetical protein [Flavobacterium praedii]|uniref:hypothetical protein n=1 Tax=Flavobacterium praedii TaxID=3002900 RepID=UPI0024819F04|nr:hypothetical protein [Flavobacterium praedii]